MAVKGDYLEIVFILSKKRRETVLQKLSTKQIPLVDPLAAYVIEYVRLLESLEPKPAFFLPRTSTVFGVNLVISRTEHISGRQVFNIIRNLSQTVWCHLFRESAAADIVRQDSSIIAAFKVQRRLDLESYATAFNYLRRFSSDIIQREQAKGTGDVIQRTQTST